MGTGRSEVSASGTSVLLVEADPDARSRHEVILISAGYSVISVALCPELGDVNGAAIVLSDIPSFQWLQDQQIRRLPPIVALADDVKAGVTACLCGAADWVPTDGEGRYLLDTVDGVLHPSKHQRHRLADRTLPKNR